MSITKEAELNGMKKVAEAVGIVLKEMREYARPGMTTRELDDFGRKLLDKFGARSAPLLTYGFPGCTCISVNKEFAHGIPSVRKFLQEGDLVNVDVSAELDGYWADNGGSFVLGQDLHRHQPLIEASKSILFKAINSIKGGVRIAEIGRLIETEAKSRGYKVIRNLSGHGIGRGLHEEPVDISNYYERSDKRYFSKHSVIAVETFIATHSSFADVEEDGWTLVGDRKGFMAQHEHTIVVTDGAPVILTEMNGIWN